MKLENFVVLNIEIWSDNRKFIWITWACAVETKLIQGQWVNRIPVANKFLVLSYSQLQPFRPVFFHFPWSYCWKLHQVSILYLLDWILKSHTCNVVFTVCLTMSGWNREIWLLISESYWAVLPLVLSRFLFSQVEI